MIDRDNNVIDLNAILHPGSVYNHPNDVLADSDLSLAEKRAILASWASDAAAVASNPTLREFPGSHSRVTIDEVLEALSSLDTDPKGPPGGKPARIKSTARAGKSDMDTILDGKLAMLRTHRRNIERYEKVLKTELTQLERNFVERRLDEERTAVAKLAASTFPIKLQLRNKPPDEAEWRNPSADFIAASSGTTDTRV